LLLVLLGVCVPCSIAAFFISIFKFNLPFLYTLDNIPQ
jgi:hypothetical protein